MVRQSKGRAQSRMPLLAQQYRDDFRSNDLIGFRQLEELFRLYVLFQR